MFGAGRAANIGLEGVGGATDRGDHAGNLGQLVDFQLVVPELPEHRIVIRPEQPVTLREQHPGAGVEGVVDPARALHGQSLRVGEPARIHVGVAHLAPEVRRTLLDRAHEFGNAQRVGQPFQLDAVCLLEFEQPLVGDIGIGRLVVGVDSDPRLFHHHSSSRRDNCSRSRAGAQCGVTKGRSRANERAPVQSSIAGPCYFVLAKDVWYRPVVFRDLKARGLCAPVLRICSDCRWRTRLAAAVCLNVHRDLAAEQGRWLAPVASCSSPRVGRRTSVRFSCLTADPIIVRQFLRREEQTLQHPNRCSQRNAAAVIAICQVNERGNSGQESCRDLVFRYWVKSGSCVIFQ